ncbi:MAG TPA: hypothetical protein DEP05_02725 [Betaproteobacteria bacterium]|nr:hypothetical protein [Betaproteobacteria bacterium]
MGLIYDLLRLIGMMTVASGAVAIMFLIWRFIYTSFKEEIDTEHYRKVAIALRQFVKKIKQVGTTEFPHVRATAAWLEEEMHWADTGEGRHRNADQIREELRAQVLPLLKEKNEKIGQIETRLHQLEALLEYAYGYKQQYEKSQDRLLSQSDRHEAEMKMEAEHRKMFDLIARLESSIPPSGEEA